MAFQPFWFDQAINEEVLTTASSPLVKTIYDATIIGGGFTGLWTAIQIKLQAPSKSVVIVEKDLCGQGASGRNGGAMLTWSTKFLSLKKRFGLAQAKFLVSQSEQAVHHIANFAKKYNIDCDLRTDGCYMTASNHAQIGLLDPCIHALETEGLNHWQSLEQHQLTKTGSRQNIAALFSPHAGSVQPAKLVRGLRRVAIELGVVILEHTQYVAHQGKMPINVEIRNAQGTDIIKSNHLVFAVNAWLPTLIPKFKRNVVLVSSDMAITEPLADTLDAINMKHGAAVIDSRIFVNYYRTTSDGRLMLGKGGNYFSFANHMSQQFDKASQYEAILARSLQHFFPDSHLPIARTWTGPSDRSVSGFPFFGEVSKHANVFYGSGYSGNGVVQSYIGGKILASLVLNQHNEWRHCALVNQSLEQFPIEPIRTLGAYLVRNGIRRKERAEDEGVKPNQLDNFLARLSGAAAKADTN